MNNNNTVLDVPLDEMSRQANIFRCEGIENKKKLFEKLAEILSDESSSSFHQILDGVNAREKMGPTYIGKGVAIPHCKLDIEQPRAVILVLDKTIKYTDDTNKQVDIIFGLLVPAQQCDEHIHLLARVAKLCDQEHWLDGLRALKNNDEMFDYLVKADAKVSELL